MTTALAHLHGRGLVHGDLYAHNIQVDAAGRALLGDFGAASFLPTDDLPRGDQPPDAGRLGDALRRFDRRALACLIDELALRCDEPAALHALRPTV